MATAAELGKLQPIQPLAIWLRDDRFSASWTSSGALAMFCIVFLSFFLENVAELCKQLVTPPSHESNIESQCKDGKINM